MRAGKVEIMRMYADTSKITGLGWKPKYSFDEGLAETIEREIALRK
jgi:nucleoside-diphosphate-sugar epimerase